MRRIRYKPLKPLSNRQKKIHSTVRSYSSKGFALTIRDISRKTKLPYATVHDNIKGLERKKLVRPTRLDTVRGRSRRKYWVARRR